MASWSARERAYQGDHAKASSSSAPARELPAKSRAVARGAAPGSDHRRGDEGAEPLRGDQEPQRNRPHVEDVAGEDRQHLLVGEDEGVHEDGDREHAQDGRVRADLPEPRQEAVQDRLAAGPAGQRHPSREAVGGGEGAEREGGERDVARGGPQPGEEEAAQERADHLGGLHRHGLERDRGGQALSARDDEQHGAARREVEHPGDPQDDLDRDQGTEPGEARCRRGAPGPTTRRRSGSARRSSRAPGGADRRGRPRRGRGPSWGRRGRTRPRPPSAASR